MMTRRRRPAPRRAGRRQVPVSVLWQQLQQRWRDAWQRTARSVTSWT